MKRLLCLVLYALTAFPNQREARIGDIAHVEGIRENSLIGYGIVVGLNGTGDRKQSLISVQALTSALKKMGIQVPANALTVSNVAAVFVTATLPPFARQGSHEPPILSHVVPERPRTEGPGLH